MLQTIRVFFLSILLLLFKVSVYPVYMWVSQKASSGALGSDWTMLVIIVTALVHGEFLAGGLWGGGIYSEEGVIRSVTWKDLSSLLLSYSILLLYQLYYSVSLFCLSFSVSLCSLLHITSSLTCAMPLCLVLSSLGASQLWNENCADCELT